MAMTTPSPCDQAIALHQSGRLAQAEALYRQAIAQDASAFVPRHYLGVLKLQQGDNEQAVALIGEALKIDPGNAEAMINYGNALKQLGRHDEALDVFDAALAARPDFAAAPYNRAILLQELGRLEDAARAYEQAVTLRPDFSAAWHERAILLLQSKQQEAALESFDRLLALEPRFAEGWSNRGVLLTDMKRFEEALASCERALAINPGFAEAWHNRANALSKLRRYDEALASFDRALALKPDAHPRAWNNRGVLLQEMKRFGEASASFTKALAIAPDYAEALYNRGKLAWAEHEDYDAALTDLTRAVALDPDYPYALGALLHLKNHGGDWSGRDAAIAAINVGVRAGKPVVEPFVYQAISTSPADQLACCRLHASLHYPAKSPLWHGRQRKPGKIRIGYVSGEFREQATAFLTAGLYEQHDRSRFEITAFDIGRADTSAMRKRLEAGFDHFTSIAGLSDEAAAQAIAAAGIDILVNLNGYFGERRMEIFAHRPAPIQVNFLGFPMTLGAPYIDAIIADRIVIPQDEQKYYSENVVLLPDSYQVNDSRRAIAAQPGRDECGLPPSGFVFCSFNQSYKLTPEVFGCWMRIVKALPGSVLWLLQGHEEFQKNIRREAQAAGVDAARIIFAPMIAADLHLARLGHADLFLDTMPCNAHTTASDALWAGVPLVTCQGSAFSGRVATSLLHAVGLEDLVTQNLAGYEALAVALALDKARLQALRQRLKDNRLRAPLFDTARYCRHLEAAFCVLLANWEQGLPPKCVTIEPINN